MGRAVAAVILALLVASCSRAPSTDDVAERVQASMQNYFDTTDYKQYFIHVTDVKLVKASDTTYNGFATLRPLRGPDGQVPITVTDDGKNALWQSPPGSMMFLMRAKP